MANRPPPDYTPLREAEKGVEPPERTPEMDANLHRQQALNSADASLEGITKLNNNLLKAHEQDRQQYKDQGKHEMPNQGQPYRPDYSPLRSHDAPAATDAGRSTVGGMGPASGTSKHMSHDELHAALGISAQPEQAGGRDGASSHDKLMDMANAPQTQRADMGWESNVSHDHDLGR